MKKIGITFLTACLGGAVAIGAYKLVETKYNDKLSFGEKQEVYFTNNPSAAISSTGDLDFTQAAAAVTPGPPPLAKDRKKVGPGSSPG